MLMFAIKITGKGTGVAVNSPDSPCYEKDFTNNKSTKQ